MKITGFLAVIIISFTSLTRVAISATLTSQTLGRGLNLGATLEAYEGRQVGYEWGFLLQAEYFPLIKQAGFQHVRVPIGWSYSKPGTAYDTMKTRPYTIRPELFARVDWVVEQALRSGLSIIIDNHHHEEISRDPVAEEERFLAIWKQIAEHYQGQSNNVYFELLNEPTGNFSLDPERWNSLLKKALTIIRQTNPNRSIIVGSAGNSSVWMLPRLQFPRNDRNLLASFHFYEPMSFTHQGADWVSPPFPKNISWTGLAPAFVIGQDSGMVFGNWPEKTPWQLQPGNTLTLDLPAWGGMYFYSYLGLAGFDTLSFNTDRALTLGIRCNGDADNPSNPWKIINTADGWHKYTVPYHECQGHSILDFIKIANFSEQTVTGLTLRNLKLRGPMGTLPLVTHELGQIRAAFDYAATWAKLNNRPVHLGEFGTYDDSKLVDNGLSRIRWIEAVRREAEQRGFAWTCWDFGSGEFGVKGFGIYNRETRKWKMGLLRALTQ